ncbi:MMPL family transporter [Sphaerisporangium fuscum]|uniref:MMPL family transporter n=1 Tax=Sphaerisporangium fuscum TaxID=2835868 RepID=UPI001BDD465B|nr:MMPL family transporter [Sphaerisporangium fuscum]
MLPESKSAGPPPSRPFVERIAGWSTRHRTLAITCWLALVVIGILSSALVTGPSVSSTDPGEAGRAERVLDQRRVNVPVLENVLIQARDGGRRFTDDPEPLEAARDLVAALSRTPDAVAAVRSPLTAHSTRLISKDGRSGLVTFEVAGPDERSREHYETAVSAIREVAARHPRVRLAQAGDRSLSLAVDEGIRGDFQRAERLSLPLTVVILLVVFGSLVAAGIPLLLALTVVAGTFGFLRLIDHWVPINSATSSMVLLIGIAVSIDYTLFYLRREREERAAGRGVAEALRVTARTSGHVVLVSGLTVMLCLGGLLFTGLDNFRGLTIGAVLVVGLALIGSVTVLPALLAVLGDRVDKGRLPWPGRRRVTAGRSRFWSAVAHAVVRRPVLWGGAALLALIVLTLPALGMRLQDAAVTDSLPRTVPVVDAALRMQDAFPGSPSPATVVVWETREGALETPAASRAATEIGASWTTRRDGVLIARVPLAHFGTGEAANTSLDTLRGTTLPAAFDSLKDVGYAVTGRTAVPYDFTEQLTGRTPLVFGFVLVLAFVLLAAAFRSLAIPLVSIVLNLLSIGAAYGVLTWTFQGGHLGGVLGFTPYGGVVGWLPLFMFVILFGLSMDYHIFILSRIRERRTAGATSRDAVVEGVGGSAGVVTGAAAIMTAAFTVFVLLTAIEYKMMGVGLSVAIVIDATVVRGVLLPAAITLLGSRAWTPPRLPRWIRRSPSAKSRPAVPADQNSSAPNT